VLCVRVALRGSHTAQASKALRRLPHRSRRWVAFALCVVSLIFYGYHAWKATVGWEEIYVVLVESKCNAWIPRGSKASHGLTRLIVHGGMPGDADAPVLGPPAHA
jgi:hypothetical protein